MYHCRINKGGICKIVVLVGVMVLRLSHQPLTPKKTVQNCQVKNINNEPILCFWQQFILPSLPWHTDATQFQVNFRQIQNLRCNYILLVEILGGGQRLLYNIMSQKMRLYQHWTGSFIRECIIMVMPTCNGTFLNILWKNKNCPSVGQVGMLGFL